MPAWRLDLRQCATSSHSAPVTISYRTTGDEPDLNTIVDKLVAKIATYQPPFAVTPTNLGDGRLELRASTAFTSHAAVQNTPVVETTQRTVVPVAQRDEIALVQSWLRDNGKPVPAADATHAGAKLPTSSPKLAFPAPTKAHAGMWTIPT